MGYYFCNLMGKNELVRRSSKGISNVKISKKLNDAKKGEAYIHEGSLNFVEEGSKCKGVKFDFIGDLNVDDKRFPSTLEMLQNTDENPILLIATKKFKVYEDIPTYIKYLPVKDGVIIALLKGCISVASPDGNMIELTRGIPSATLRRGYVFEPEEINSMNILEDEESGICYSDYVVSDCIVDIKYSKDDRLLKNLRFNKKYFSILDNKVFEEGAAKKKAREELQKKRLEEARLLREKRTAEAKYKAYEEEMEKQLSKDSKSNDSYSVVGSEGAQAFLDIIAGLK